MRSRDHDSQIILLVETFETHHWCRDGARG